MDDKNNKILIVGAGAYPIYETALYNAFVELGYANARLFTWNKYYKNNNNIWTMLTKLEYRYGMGLQTRRFNRIFVRECKSLMPDIVFLYSCRMILPSSVRKVKRMGIYIASYCNDDPFSKKYRKSFWRNYRNSLNYCDVNYVYRHANITDVEKKTGVPAKLLRAYYIDKSNYPCSTSELVKDVPDIIFLGHIENDERTEYLDALIERGVRIGLNEIAYGKWAKNRQNVVFLDNPRDWYNRYICSCKIPLVFLSKLNRDTYTRRCFEIPAAGAFLFCPYTSDLASMFKENEEIVFFRSKEDFIEKVDYYLEHDEERVKIAIAGRNRLLKDGYEVKDRAKEIINDFIVKFAADYS